MLCSHGSLLGYVKNAELYIQQSNVLLSYACENTWTK